MSKKNLLSGRDKELYELAERYETAKAENKPIYLDADDLTDLADWYAVRRKRKQANEVVEYGLTLHPGSTPLLVEQAYLFIDIQERDKARQVIEQITEDYSPEVKVLKANLLLGEDKIDEVEQLLDTIEDKEDLANIIDISYMYIDMGYPDKAMQWLKKGEKKYAEEEAFMATTADCLHTQGLNIEAEKFYNKLIDKNPYSPSYWYGLARCYYEQEQFDKVIEACDYAIVADEEFSDAYLLRANAFSLLGNEEKALDDYMMAEKYNAVTPDFVQMFAGFNAIAQEHWEEGYRHLESATQYGNVEQATLSPIYAHMALCLYKLGDVDKAVQYFAKAHEYDPEDAEAYFIEGRMYMELGQPDKAVEAWDITLTYAACAETWHTIGKCCAELGQLNHARVALEQVKALEPQFKDIDKKLSAIYLLLNDKDNFLKYNQHCEHPLLEADLKYITSVEKSEDKTRVMNIIKDLLDTLR